MQKILTVLSLCCISFLLYSQAPRLFKYQAIARDASGDILVDADISFRINILQGSTSGTSVYAETHNVTTNQFGSVNLEIGNGTVILGSMSAISWGNDEFFVQIEMDPASGTDYQDMGTSQLLSVPYALDAAKVEQRVFDSLETTHQIKIGDGLKINSIYEITGRTDENEDFVWVELPDGLTAIESRVLDVSIYLYVFMGNGVYYGLGSGESDGVVGYWLSRSDDGPCYLHIEYPELLRDKPFRATLMKVTDSVIIE